MGREECSVMCAVWRKQWEVRSVKCGVWSLSLECEERSVKCEVWSVRFGVWRKQWEVWSVDCEVWSVSEVWSVKCEVRSVKFGVWSLEWEGSSEKWEVWSVDCEVWSVKCEVRSVKFGVWRKQWEVWSEKCEGWTVKCGVRRAQCEVWGLECEGSSEKCEVWTVKCEVWVKCGVWSAKWEVWSVKFGVWSLEWEGSSEKWEVWSVDCEVWSVKCEVRSVKFGVWRKQWEVRSVNWEVWNVECEVWSVKCEVWSAKWEVWTVKCEVWSVDCEVWSVKCGLWSVKCAVWSVKCEVWGLECEGSSEKWEVWSVKCGVWSLKFGVRRVQCAVWGVECRGKDTVGTGWRRTIGHLCLGNFRRRLARVYVNYMFFWPACLHGSLVSYCFLGGFCLFLTALLLRVFHQRSPKSDWPRLAPRAKTAETRPGSMLWPPWTGPNLLKSWKRCSLTVGSSTNEVHHKKAYLLFSENALSESERDNFKFFNSIVLELSLAFPWQASKKAFKPVVGNDPSQCASSCNAVLKSNNGSSNEWSSFAMFTELPGQIQQLSTLQIFDPQAWTWCSWAAQQKSLNKSQREHVDGLAQLLGRARVSGKAGSRTSTQKRGSTTHNRVFQRGDTTGNHNGEAQWEQRGIPGK